ncbi:MAG: hypothetical protein U5J83_10335 [Bryobacterales bacterium]|nr:hypothetical protein [Bryobacterales bacterium]
MTPSLRRQIDESPAVLRDLVRFLAGRIAGPDGETVASEAISYIETRLPRDYPWAGNYRELEQCIRNILVRQEYLPPPPPRTVEGDDRFAGLREGLLSAEDLLCRYCTLVYSQTGSYEGAAARLGLDRRTVKAKVEKAATVE